MRKKLNYWNAPWGDDSFIIDAEMKIINNM